MPPGYLSRANRKAAGLSFAVFVGESAPTSQVIGINPAIRNERKLRLNQFDGRDSICISRPILAREVQHFSFHAVVSEWALHKSQCERPPAAFGRSPPHEGEIRLMSPS